MTISVLCSLQELWHRGTTDDLLFVFLVLLNQYVTPVKEVRSRTSESVKAPDHR
jgi:hypothetical protein